MQRNVTDKEADARPEIADPLDSIANYQQVLLGSPIWNVRPPIILNTFSDRYDFTAKTVQPFVTYAVSGLGSTQRVYTEACAGADVSAGLAVGAKRSPQAPGRRRDLAPANRLLSSACGLHNQQLCDARQEGRSWMSEALAP